MTPARVNTLFQRIGASTTALNVSKPISPRVNYSQSEQDLFRGKELYSSILVSDVADWSKLVSILELLGRISNQYVDTAMFIVWIFAYSLLQLEYGASKTYSVHSLSIVAR